MSILCIDMESFALANHYEIHGSNSHTETHKFAYVLKSITFPHQIFPYVSSNVHEISSNEGQNVHLHLLS